MAIYRVRETPEKGTGLFTAQDIPQGEHLPHLPPSIKSKYRDRLQHLKE